jgi:predicted nucleic acid-binding protein
LIARPRCSDSNTGLIVPGLPFLDTYILVRHFTQDHSIQSPRASAYLQRIEDGDVRVHTEPTVTFETVYLLGKQYKIPRTVVRDGLLALLDLPGIAMPGKKRIRDAFALYIERNLPFADACHIAAMRAEGLNEIVTFDREFDRISGIARIEP